MRVLDIKLLRESSMLVGDIKIEELATLCIDALAALKFCRTQIRDLDSKAVWHTTATADALAMAGNVLRRVEAE